MEQLKRNSSSAQRAVTLRDVEDGAVNLRKVGETLATLKGTRRHAMPPVKLETAGLVINGLSCRDIKRSVAWRKRAAACALKI